MGDTGVGMRAREDCLRSTPGLVDGAVHLGSEGKFLGEQGEDIGPAGTI